MKKIIASLFLFLVVLMPLSFVYAANPFTEGTKNLNTAVGGLGLASDVQTSVGTVIKGVLGLVGTIFFGLTIYAGILWMTSAGNEEKVTEATNIIKAAIIGLFITMAAYAITTFVASKLGGVADQSGGGGGGGAGGPCQANGGVCSQEESNCGFGLATSNYDCAGGARPICCKLGN